MMDYDFFGLADKVALVVGGGQGMGEASSITLAHAGCTVVVMDLVLERAQAVADAITAFGGRAAAMVGDVLDDDRVEGLVGEAEQAFGRLDVLVSVVGATAFYKPLMEISGEEWDIEQRLNQRYCFLLSKAFAALRMKAEAPGTITLISSVSGIASAPRHGPYGAAKAGLMNLVKTMAVEWAPYGIRVNSIAPGSIVTPRLPDGPHWDEMMKRSNHPMQRRGTTDEIAKAVLFLASEQSSYVTGQTLPVDGGITVANVMAIPGQLKTALATPTP